MIIKSLINHMLVDLTSGVAFTELEALEVLRQSLVDHILKRLVVLPRRTWWRIIRGENS